MNLSLFKFRKALPLLPLVFSIACTRNADPEFSNSISTQANLNALGPSLKELQPHWSAEQRQGTSWAMAEMSLENSVVPFQRSSQRLTLDLLLETADSLDALRFARSLTPEYKSKAISILEISTQVGMDSWGHDFFDSILQTRPSLERLSSLQRTFSAALAFTSQEQRRSGLGVPDSGRDGIHQSISDRQDDARVELLSRAIEEKWEAEQFEDLEVILGVARLEHPCGKLPTRSLMVRCLGPSLFTRQETGFFAPSYGRRYQELAKEILVQAMDHHDVHTAQSIPSLGDALFATTPLLWSHCESEQFSIKRALLRGSIRALAGENDDIHRVVMERQVRDVLRDCTTSANTNLTIDGNTAGERPPQLHVTRRVSAVVSAAPEVGSPGEVITR